jgi:hypothetical protein
MYAEDNHDILPPTAYIDANGNEVGWPSRLDPYLHYVAKIHLCPTDASSKINSYELNELTFVDLTDPNPASADAPVLVPVHEHHNHRGRYCVACTLTKHPEEAQFQRLRMRVGPGPDTWPTHLSVLFGELFRNIPYLKYPLFNDKNSVLALKAGSWSHKASGRLSGPH